MVERRVMDWRHKTFASCARSAEKVSRELRDFREALENLKSELISQSLAYTAGNGALPIRREIFMETRKKKRPTAMNRGRSAEKYFVLCGSTNCARRALCRTMTRKMRENFSPLRIPSQVRYRYLIISLRPI